MAPDPRTVAPMTSAASVPRLSRRSFLAALAAGAAGVATGCSGSDGDGASSSSTAVPPTTPVARPSARPSALFGLGVASGDPLADSVVLWTRLAPGPGGGAPPTGHVSVGWEVADDEEFTAVVASGEVAAVADLAHSVHVDARGLAADRWYWYRFTVDDEVSPVGRTRTTPAPDASPDRLRFAFASCQDWADGRYTAHDHLAEEDLDLVVFLGDYIYETGAGDEGDDAVRRYDTDEPVDLAGYRARYALHKSDPSLQAAHARCPWLLTWDDHEVDDNYAGAVAGDGASGEGFLARRAAAYQAYYEHQPLRVDPPTGPDLRIHRSFAFGDLLTFFVLDTRQYRDAQPCDDEDDLGRACEAVEGTDLLGAEQEAWLFDGLRSSGAIWNVVAQQVVMTPVEVPFGDPPLVNLDQWDGYPSSRQRLLEVFADGGVANPVVLSGDIHAGGAADLHRDPTDTSSPTVAAEFVGPSISSAFPARFVALVEAAAAVASPLGYLNASQRGYVRCEVTRDRWRTDYRLVDTTSNRTSAVATDATFELRAGRPGIERL